MISAALVPAAAIAVMLYARARSVPVFSAFSEGVKRGLSTLLSIFPSLLLMVTAVSMLRASGLLAFLSGALRPLTDAVNFPEETVPLLLIRPFSGSGATAALGDILSLCGPDSYAGRVASVMMGSSETTFYTIALYFGAADIKKTRHTVPAAVVTDVAAYLFAAFFVRMLLE